MAKDEYILQVPVPRALYAKIKLRTIEAGLPIRQFLKPEFTMFVALLVKALDARDPDKQIVEKPKLEYDSADEAFAAGASFSPDSSIPLQTLDPQKNDSVNDEPPLQVV